MTDIYDKLEIPEPSADLESRIIAAANAGSATQKKHFFPRLAVVAACFLIAVTVLQPQESYEVADAGYLDHIEFFDEQYGFTDEIEFAEEDSVLDIDFFDEQYGFAEEIS